jgi:hypothetical protein
MKFNRLRIHANDKIMLVADVLWPITLIARYTVDGLKSDLQKSQKKTKGTRLHYRPQALVGWTLVHQVK